MAPSIVVSNPSRASPVNSARHTSQSPSSDTFSGWSTDPISEPLLRFARSEAVHQQASNISVGKTRVVGEAPPRYTRFTGSSDLLTPKYQRPSARHARWGGGEGRDRIAPQSEAQESFRHRGAMDIPSTSRHEPSDGELTEFEEDEQARDTVGSDDDESPPCSASPRSDMADYHGSDDEKGKEIRDAMLEEGRRERGRSTAAERLAQLLIQGPL